MGQRIYGLLGLLLISPNVFAHGVVGDRFFPATLTIDDPFVADEMSLITIGTLKSPATGNSPATRETDYGMDVSKRISRDWGIGAAATYKDFKGEDGSSVDGFDNIDTNVQYQFFKSPDQEVVSSLKLDWEMGGTGNVQIADKFSRFTPSWLFGKGFGDLPEETKYLRPLALTGVFGTSFPTHNTDLDAGNTIPKNAIWGFTVQYNLQYLQSNVKDIGLPQPFSRMIPLVEFPMTTPWNGDQKGQTTGTANPGVIWFGRYIQLALEAQLPINAASGKGAGAIGQIHLYLDDIAPKIFTWTPFSGVLGPTQAK
jgi:hypothetical protein